MSNDDHRTDEAPANASPTNARRPSLPDFFVIVHRFRGVVGGLRELLMAIAPHAAELDEKRLTPQEMATLAELPKKDHVRLVGAFEEIFSDAAESQEAPASANDLDASSLDGENLAPESSTLEDSESTMGGETEIDPSARALAEVFSSNPLALQKFAEGVFQMADSSREELLNASLLTVAVAAFESLLASVVTQHYERFPGQLSGDEPEFSLRELLEFTTLDDAKEAAIAARVDSFMRRNLDDWSKWLERTLKLSLRDAAIDYPTLKEAFLRRHIIVHNSGRASKQYVASLDDDATKPDVGEPLAVKKDYLERALDELDVAGSLIGLTAWCRWVPDEGVMARRTLLDQGYSLLRDERYPATCHFCTKSLALATTEHQRHVMAVNRWTALKQTKGIEAIRKEVDEWDTSALSDTFALTKLALLDEVPNAMKALDHLLATERLTIDEADSWPVLASLRSDDAFAELTAAYRD